MNFGKGGQNIVQAGNSTPNVFRGAAGNILSAYLGTKMKRQERDYHRQADEESRIRINKAESMDKAAAEVFKNMVNPVAGSLGAAKAYRIAMETYPEGHEKAGQFVNEEMANQVKRYGFDVGYRPAKTPASITQVEQWQKYRDSDPKIESKTSNDEYAGTVARFGKDGKITREPVTLEDIEYGEKTSERPPASLTQVDDSSRPSNQTWTAQQKADLEKERPRTNNLKTGINDGREHETNVMNAWGEGKVTTGEAIDLLPDNSEVRKHMNQYGSQMDTNESIQADHARAGLDDRKGTKY